MSFSSVSLLFSRYKPLGGYLRIMPMGPDGWEMLTAPVVILSGHLRHMAPTRDMLQSLWYTHVHSQDFVLLHSYLPQRQKLTTCYWCYLWLTHMHSHDFLLLRRYLPQNSVLGTCYWCTCGIRTCTAMTFCCFTDIYHRILRFKNYMVAMANVNTLPLKHNLPFIGE